MHVFANGLRTAKFFFFSSGHGEFVKTIGSAIGISVSEPYKA